LLSLILAAMLSLSVLSLVTFQQPMFRKTLENPWSLVRTTFPPLFRTALLRPPAPQKNRKRKCYLPLTN